MGIDRGLLLSLTISVLIYSPKKQKKLKRGFLPGIILLTHGYYHWGTRLNAM